MEDDDWTTVLDWCGLVSDGVRSAPLAFAVAASETGLRVRDGTTKDDHSARACDFPLDLPVGSLIEELTRSVLGPAAALDRLALTGVADAPNAPPRPLLIEMRPLSPTGNRSGQVRRLGGSRRVAHFSWDSTTTLGQWLAEVRRAVTWCDI